ncbi:MAG: hypothetical protein IJL05_03695 [Alphaproteobacteria bacterium]|nr:hypothetical protein [Alphaproteobacteria bacterium]
MIKFIKLGCLIFVTSCNLNTQYRNNSLCSCDIIYGRLSDWNTISDDLARHIYEHNLKCEKQIDSYSL